MAAPNIYSYTDSLEFLKDWFEYQKSHHPHFSYATFSRKAGFKSRSFIQLVLKDERKISSKSLFQMIQGIGLQGAEAHFFEALVDFRQAKSHEEKDMHWQRIRKLGKSSPLAQIRAQEFDFFKKWYLAPLREIVCNFDFQQDFTLLAQMLIPKISKLQAQSGFELLKNLKLIQLDNQGQWEHSDQHVHASSLTQSLAVRQFQKENNRLAEQSLDRFSRQERNISTITLGTNQNGFQALNELIREFQENVVKIVEENEGADQVFQLNLQLFPVSKNWNKGK